MGIKAVSLTSSVFSAQTTSLWSSVDTEKTDENLVELFADLESDWNEGRFENIVDGIDCILDKYFPAFTGLLRSALLAIKSKAYQELGNWEQALAVLEEACSEFNPHQKTIGDFLVDYDFSSYLQMQKAGLLLLLKREEEAIEILRENEPDKVEKVLLYRLIEKELGISLLKPQSLHDENDIRELFFAGLYEEVIQKTEADTTSDFQDSITLRIASLAMLGRLEEAQELYEERSLVFLTFDDHVGFLLKALDGKREYLNTQFSIEEEFELPMGVFAKWLLQTRL